MDTKSFIDYFLVNEVARNADGFKKSVFFHKDKYSNGGKLNAGPVWDFDWAWKNLSGVCSYYEGYSGAGWAHLNNDCFTDNYSTGWYVRLLQDSTFRNELRCAYDSYRATMLDTTALFAYIDSMGARVQHAQARHFQKWPILGVSGPAPDFGPVATTYYAELDTLKQWISTRIQWLDANIPGLCAVSGTNEDKVAAGFNCYPNPTNDDLTVEYALPTAMEVSLHLYNQIGVEVLSTPIAIQDRGRHLHSLATAKLLPGVYILKLNRGDEVITQKIVVLK